MTSMLEKAFSEAAKLPDVEQNALARWVLDEIEGINTRATTQDILDAISKSRQGSA